MSLCAQLSIHTWNVTYIWQKKKKKGNLYRHKFITFLKAEEMEEFPSGCLKKTAQFLQDFKLFWRKYFPSRLHEMFFSVSVRGMAGHLAQEQTNSLAYHILLFLLSGCCCFPSSKMDAGQSAFTMLSDGPPPHLHAQIPRNSSQESRKAGQPPNL